jgi:hypothetical protein
VTDGSASYSFLPWLRQGLASEITRADDTLPGAPRAEVPITITIDAAGDPREVTAVLALFGPGEVAALDPRVVIRTAAKAGETDAEPNELPMVEFDQPDLPWCYTPAKAGASTRLRPWLVLAVLTADEIAEETPAGGDGRLPAITVASAAALPRLEQSWAWAHVQVEGLDPATETVEDVARGQPRRVRSRLLAPRYLTARTAYTAVLVPAFERGRRAGLREPLDESVDALAAAWGPDDVDIRLPVYYRWWFQTGEQGDFEQLARRLRARRVDASVGLRGLDVGTPDPALPAASTNPLDMEGALRSPAAAARPWDPTERAAFVQRLAELLNRQADVLVAEGEQRLVAPPLWARWHAAADRLDPAAGVQPVWFHELNADPRLRATAGLGAEVVRRNDQQLMAGAWDQVEGILEANEKLRRAQLAREASAKLLANHLAKLDTESFLQVTGPLHARFTASETTVHERLRVSPLPDGALDGQLRRIGRPAGPVRRRQARHMDGAAPGGGLLERLNRRELRSRPPVATPEEMLVSERLEGALGRESATRLARERPEATEGRGRTSAGTLTADEVRLIRPAPTFRPGVAGGLLEDGEVAFHRPVPIGGDPATDPATAASVTAFQRAFVDLVAATGAPPTPGPVLRPANLPGVGTTLLSKMDPRVTIPAAITHYLTIAPWVTWGQEDPLEPVMVAPEFDRPMYEPLRDLGQDWLLPGVGSILPDTVTLVLANQRFVEAYMAGLSHEMARELLYHEYPTDQRGTYFRQFWDVRGHVPTGGGPPNREALRDIRRIHGWRRAQGLGANTGRTPPPREDHVVLLVQGELLRRYPNTIVYAVNAVRGRDGQRTLGTTEQFPVFSGRLDPDISFFGFDLLPGEARGPTGPSAETAADQGWFFVLQEHPSEPRFGLDADNGQYGAKPASWNDLNWAHLAASQHALDVLGYLDLDADLPDTSAVVRGPDEPALAWHADHGLGATGANGSDLAWITLQRPFRVAIHGADMLPGASA